MSDCGTLFQAIHLLGVTPGTEAAMFNVLVRKNEPNTHLVTTLI